MRSFAGRSFAGRSFAGRLFAGIDLPWSVREQLGALSGAGIPGARWIPDENYHLTLRFIGEVPAYVAEEIDHALAAIKTRPFTLTLAGTGTFTKAGRSVALWIGAEKNPQLNHLRGKIETALQRCGLDAERRRFQPHVTLARLDNPVESKLASFLQTHNLFRADPIEVDHFTLFSSLLGKEQAIYTAEAEYPLG